MNFQKIQILLKDGLKKYANKLKYKDDMIILKSQLITYRIRKDNIIIRSISSGNTTLSILPHPDNSFFINSVIFINVILS